jgi:hypothetical protein
VSRVKDAWKLAEDVVGMQRALPGAQNRRVRQRRVQSVEMPEDTAGAAGHDGAVRGGALLAAVADGGVALGVAEAMEIWSLLLIAPLFPAVTVSRLKQT